MELITNIIIEYLKHNKRLVVPKLGAFIVKQPGNKIIFSELMRGEDSTLRMLLVAYGMSEMEASGAIDRMVFEIRHAVNNGGSYTIEKFGVFTAGDNNNILFKQQREPITIGGNIKPPIERLNEAKRLMRRTSQEYGEQPMPRRSATTSAPRSRKSVADSDDDVLNLTKPDSYLRGLKYENKKEKGRDDDYRRNGRGNGMSRRGVLMILGVLALLAAIFMAWYLWLGDDNDTSTAATVEGVVEQYDVLAVPDTLIMSDSLTINVDSLTNAEGIIK